MVSGWGKITTTSRDALRKLEFGTNARSLRYVAIPIANKVCSEDEEIKKIAKFDPSIKICAGGEEGIVPTPIIDPLEYVVAISKK